MKYEYIPGDDVIVNGRSGEVVKVTNKKIIVKTNGTGFIGEYELKKVHRRYNHCNKCSRRLKYNSKQTLCKLCRGK